MFQFIINFYIVFFITFVNCKIDPLSQFYNYTVITPKYYNEFENEINLNSFNDNEFNCNKINFIKLYNGTLNLFNIKVFVNNQFISNKYFESYQLNGEQIIDNQKKNSNECFYHGYILNQQLINTTNIINQILALNLFRFKLVNGFINFNDKYLFLHYHDNLNKTILFDDDYLKPNENELKCGYDNDNFILNDYNLNNKKLNHHVIDKRSVKIHGVYQQNSQTRFVELVIVNDHKLFLEYNKDKDRLINRSKSIANIVNTLYNQLNVFIILVGVEVWTEHDEIEITQNGDETLNKFLKYRKDKLLKQYYNDNAQLLTNITFKDNVVGKALKGPICTEDYSGGVNSDHNKLIDVVATTMAHEMFHNFGGEHDPIDSKDSRVCVCPQAKCIMSPSSGLLTPRYWSNCSIESFKEIYQHGMDKCLENLPKETLSPSCGNGILEGNEECDCGTQENCLKMNNNCCNFKNCKLKVNSTCGTGNCCNLNTCQLFTVEQKKICRKSNDFCDLTEFCDGRSEFCPQDIWAHNGLKCTVNNDEAYCFDGKCQSHKSQCKLLFGQSAQVSIDRCYQENANNASQAANCGVEFSRFGDRRFKACKKKDIFCGRLHCIHKNKLEYGLDSASTQSLISRNGTVICTSAVIDIGVNLPDPGLVANGVKCGENKMCLNQECINIPTKGFCKYDCNGNGICNSLGECSCYEGFNPPYCDRFSFLSTFIFFLLLCSLITISIALLHRNRERIQTWWIVRQRTNAIKKRAKSTTFKLDKPTMRNNRNTNINFDLKNLEISSPIPISNNNLNNDTNLVNQITINPNQLDYTNENINRLWESNPNDIRPEAMNKFVQLPTNVNDKKIEPIRKAPPPPISKKPSSRPNQSNLGNELNIETSANFSQSNKSSVSKIREKFEI